MLKNWYPATFLSRGRESARSSRCIRQFVECESPSDDPSAVNRFVELVSDTRAPMARVKTHAGGKFGKHLVCEMHLPGRKKTGQVLALGHSDTVWPMGTLRDHAVSTRPRAACGGRACSI